MIEICSGISTQFGIVVTDRDWGRRRSAEVGDGRNQSWSHRYSVSLTNALHLKLSQGHRGKHPLHPF